MRDSSEHTSEIYALWDQLAEFDTADGEQSIRHLLSALCALVDGSNALWIAAVRMPEPPQGDPVQGWRPTVRRYLRPTELLTTTGHKQAEMLEAGEVDITTVRNVAQAGRYRANRLADLADDAWFDGDYYRYFYREVGLGDAIWVGCPVNEDAEVYFGVYRTPSQPRFTPGERDLMLTVQRGLRWFHRRQLLNHGLLMADQPLTEAERRVLQDLLGGLAEKDIAARQYISPHTVHDHVKRIYRKFGVRSRAKLTALWLGRSE